MGLNQFMEYFQETVHAIHSVGFGSAMGEKATWLINEKGLSSLKQDVNSVDVHLFVTYLTGQGL